MKIGILTWFCAMNYGAQAQTYALVKVIEKMGHTCEDIAYYPSKIRLTNIKCSLNINEKWYFDFRQIFYSLHRMRKFRKFINKQKTSQRIKDIKEIDDQKYDIIIIGSDEVVNCMHPLNEEIYFGAGIKNTPVMFYAPSSGALNTKYELNSVIRESLKKFVSLSGRDFHTCEFLFNNIQKEIFRVLDPTFLYDFNDIVVDIDIDNYVLIYSFEDLNHLKSQICQYARKNNLKIIAVGRYCTWADLSFPTATVEEWVSLFIKAKLIVTDSFHGLIFTLKNNKEFVLVGRNDKLNKNSDLLKEFDISRSYYEPDKEIDEYIKAKPINYIKVNQLLDIKIKESIQYIEKALAWAAERRAN